MKETFADDPANDPLDPEETFQDNLPWYVNGTLDSTEKAAMEDYIRDHPLAAKELAAYRQFTEALQAQWSRLPDEIPSFDRLRDRIRSEQDNVTVQTPRSTTPSHESSVLASQMASGEELKTGLNDSERLPTKRHSTLWQRLERWLGTTVIWPRLAGAAALVVITVQTALLGVLHNDLRTVVEREAEFRTSSTATVIGPFIRVVFQAEAKEVDIRVLLIGIGASYVAGPSQLGDYYILVDRKYADQAVNQLRASPLVRNAESVTKVPALD